MRKDPSENFPTTARRVTFLIHPDQTVAKVYQVSDPGEHPAEVLADLRQLTAQG